MPKLCVCETAGAGAGVRPSPLLDSSLHGIEVVQVADLARRFFSPRPERSLGSSGLGFFFRSEGFGTDTSGEPTR